MTDAVANVAAAAHLVLGIERSDLTLISRGLADRLHQQRRAEVYPRSIELLSLADEVGAIGATVSGAGPSVLFWCFWQDTGKVVDALGSKGATASRSAAPASRRSALTSRSCRADARGDWLGLAGGLLPRAR